MEENKIIQKAEDQEILYHHQNDSRGGWGNSKYDKDICPQIAFKVMSSKALKSKCALAVALQCSSSTIDSWLKKYPEFNEAFERGKAIGESKFRDDIEKHIYKPTSSVNNGLLKMLAANVYGIKDESPTIVVNNISKGNVTQALKQRGIPIPEIGIKSIEECAICDVCDKDNCKLNDIKED